MGESRTGLEKVPARGFQHGERCCWETGKILLRVSMGALAKGFLGHPSWGLGCQINLLTIPVSGAADSGLRSGFITRYGWSGQMTNKPGAMCADEEIF